MCTCAPEIKVGFHAICEIVIFKVENESYYPGCRMQRKCLFWWPKKDIFERKFDMRHFIFLFLGDLGTCIHNLHS